MFKKLLTFFIAGFMLIAFIDCNSVYAADNGAQTKEAQKAAKEAQKIAKEKGEIDALSQKILTRLYAKQPNAQNVIKKCYGYATIGATGTQFGILGDSHGRGIAINNETGEKIYLSMKEYKLGIGIGIKEFDLIFVFATPDAWKLLTNGKFKFGGEAEAAATDNINGASLEGAVAVDKGMWVYQSTTKGLTVGLNLKGLDIYPNKKLNEKK